MTGSFYLLAPRQSSSPHWLPFSFGGGSSKSSLERSIGQVLTRLDASRSLQLSGADVGAETQTFRCEGAGLKVAFSTKSIAGELRRVKPVVFQTRHHIVVFYGYLSNLEDMLELLSQKGRKGLGSPAVSPTQDGALAAELLLHMYKSTRASDLLIMLSELQGQYSFVIHDATRKHVFAARDPSGREPLYYAVDDDENLSFTNKPFEVPGGERHSDWDEVPPGHFISGRNPRLQQFALTPEQLHDREVYESMDGDMPSPDSTVGYSTGRPPDFSGSSSHSIVDVETLFRISM